MNKGPVTAGSFTEEVLPHLDSAYNLARWLVRNVDDADDIAEFHAAQGTVKPCCKRSSRDVQAARRKPRR